MFKGTETMRESRGTRKLQVVQCGLDWGPGFCSGPLGVTIQGLSVPGCNQDGFEFQDPKSQEEPTSCKKRPLEVPRQKVAKRAHGEAFSQLLNGSQETLGIWDCWGSNEIPMPCLKLSLYSFEMFKENPENNILPYFIH